MEVLLSNRAIFYKDGEVGVLFVLWSWSLVFILVLTFKDISVQTLAEHKLRNRDFSEYSLCKKNSLGKSLKTKNKV